MAQKTARRKMVSVVLSAISGRDTIHPKPGGGGCDQAATIRPPIWEVIVLVVVIIIGTMRLI